jgi:CheY-like chemotaxis protein
MDLLPGTYARLTVTDTGIGMGKDVIDKVFDPYFTTKEIGKGTGLGLSVVHGIVKECNGNILIHSELRKGTEIHVYIPIIERRATKRPETTGPVIGGTEKILLVDDEEAVLRMEERMLERLGYQVTTRTSSIESLETFKANSEYFDLVVSDMAMPNMNGIQLAQKIKKIKADIPIIISTGFSEQLTDEKCQALGIQGYVMKPVIIRELAETIRNVLDAFGES